MGFDKTRPINTDDKPSNKKVDSMLDIDIDELLGASSETEEVKVDTNEEPVSNKESEPKTKSEPRRNPKTEKGNSSNKMLVLACVSIVAIVIIIAIVAISGSSKSKEIKETAQPVVSQPSTVEEDDSKRAGIDNLNSDTQRKNTSVITDPSSVTKDLNGKEVDSDYNIKSIKTLTEVIGYSKYRTLLGDGLEFYWLDVDYKGQPYKVQVPLAIYKELSSNKGYVVVDAEVTTTTEGSEIITYMSVRKDQKSYLDKVGK